MNWRMLPPVNVQNQTKSVNGRTYTATPGSYLDLPDFDGQVLEANGWAKVAPSGPTSGRPVGVLGLYPAIPGAKYFDTTLSLLIVSDGSTWRNPANGAAV